MSEDDAARRAIAQMRPEQQADLYDAVAADFSGIGITKSVFLHNMATLNNFNEMMRPAQRAWDDAVAASPSQAIRDAKRRWEQAAEALRTTNQPTGRPLAEIEQDRREALRAYEAAINACGDQHVIEARRAYRETLRTATDIYSRNLR
jgi:hypothetical protein